MQNMELREAHMVRYQVDNLRVQNWESLLLRNAPIVRCQLEMEMEMASLRDLHLERNYLVQNVELK